MAVDLFSLESSSLLIKSADAEVHGPRKYVFSEDHQLASRSISKTSFQNCDMLNDRAQHNYPA